MVVLVGTEDWIWHIGAIGFPFYPGGQYKTPSLRFWGFILSVLSIRFQFTKLICQHGFDLDIYL